MSIPDIATRIGRIGTYSPMTPSRFHGSKLVKCSARQCAFELYQPERMVNKNPMALLRGNGFANEVLKDCTYHEVTGEVKRGDIKVAFSADATHDPDNAVIESKYCGNALYPADIPDWFFGSALSQLLFYTALYNASKTLKEFGRMGVELSGKRMKDPCSFLIFGLRNEVRLWGFQFPAKTQKAALDMYFEKARCIKASTDGDWSQAESWDRVFAGHEWHDVFSEYGMNTEETKLKGTVVLANP